MAATHERLTKATKENDVIYHERIPAPGSLPAIARAMMVKAVPQTPDANPPAPLFEKVPTHASATSDHERVNDAGMWQAGPESAHAAWAARAGRHHEGRDRLQATREHPARRAGGPGRESNGRAERVRRRPAALASRHAAVWWVVRTADGSATTAGGVGCAWSASALVALNLPAAVEALEQPSTLSERFLQQAAEVRSQGGARSLTDIHANISLMAQRCSVVVGQVCAQPESWAITCAGPQPGRCALAGPDQRACGSRLRLACGGRQVNELLDSEQAEDNRLRQQFGARWSRMPSSTLTASMRSDVAESMYAARCGSLSVHAISVLHSTPTHRWLGPSDSVALQQAADANALTLQRLNSNRSAIDTLTGTKACTRDWVIAARLGLGAARLMCWRACGSGRRTQR